jgi:hypothetical protein
MQTKRKLSLSKETLRNLQPAEMRMAAGGISGVACLVTETIGISLQICYTLTDGDTEGPPVNQLIGTSA